MKIHSLLPFLLLPVLLAPLPARAGAGGKSAAAEAELHRTAILGADFAARGAAAFEAGTKERREALLADLLALGRSGDRPARDYGGLLPAGTADLLDALKEIAEGRPKAALARCEHPETGGHASGALHFARALALLALKRTDEAFAEAERAAKGMTYASEANALAALAAQAAGDPGAARAYAAKAGRAAPKLSGTISALVAAPPAAPAGPATAPEGKPEAAKPPAKAASADPFADRPIPALVPFKPGADEGRIVRIGISTEKGRTIPRKTLRVRAEGALRLAECEGKKPHAVDLSARRAHTLTLGKGGKILVDGDAKRALRLPVELAAERGGIYVDAVRFGIGYPWQGSEPRLYRGALRLEREGDGFRMVNRIALERYLAGVLPAEMPHGSPVEALKAQAVAARSESLHKAGRHAKLGYDLCDDVCCQAYRGASWEKPRTNGAIESTLALVLLHGGKPIDAVYGACCGGHSQSSADLTGWGSRPFLTGRPDRADGKSGGPFGFLFERGGDYCAHAGAQYRWFRILPEDLFVAAAREKLDLDGLERLLPVARNPSGHLEKIALFDGRRRAIVEKELKIRDAFTYGHVRSGKFLPVMIEGARGRFLVLIGAGFGHGVGLCQEGAIGMANAKRDFRSILRHYFPGATLERLPK